LIAVRDQSHSLLQAWRCGRGGFSSARLRPLYPAGSDRASADVLNVATGVIGADAVGELAPYQQNRLKVSSTFAIPARLDISQSSKVAIGAGDFR